MYKKIIPIVLIALFVAFMLFRVGTGMIRIVNSPKTEFYFNGAIFGSTKEISDSKFSFKTYDKDMREVRTGDISLFLRNRFVLTYGEDEKYIQVYSTWSKPSLAQAGYVAYPLIEPDGVMELKFLKGRTVSFCYNNFAIEEITPRDPRKKSW